VQRVFVLSRDEKLAIRERRESPSGVEDGFG
jgi:hypothetical protein